MHTGIESIDNWHRSIFGHASHLLTCADFEVPEIFRSLVATVEQTFAHEQRLMEDYDFPVLHCHLEQHARVLAALHETHPAIMNGDCGVARKVGGELLPQWLQLHIATQDVTLGVWIAYSQNPAMLAKEASASSGSDQIVHSPYSDDVFSQLCRQRAILQKDHRHFDPLL